MSKITKSAQGQDCTIRLYEHCNFNPETTVFAHLGGGGMGRKKSDLHGAYSCSGCHDVIDGRINTVYTRDALELAHRQGVERTQDILVEIGLLRIGRPWGC